MLSRFRTLAIQAGQKNIWQVFTTNYISLANCCCLQASSCIFSFI